VEIKRLHQTLENTMIYVTHVQIEALTLADRIAVMKGGIIQQLDEPLTIYNRPANLFVAGFLGSPSMNFLPGELAGNNGRTVFRGQGLEVPIDGYKPSNGKVGSGSVVLGVRPEHIRFDEQAAGCDCRLDGEVELEEPMGADSLVWLKVGERSVSVRCSSGKRYRPGARVPIAFDMPMASIFDAKTENRL
jgi:multiple sugar transport system ATP-binding protein